MFFTRAKAPQEISELPVDVLAALETATFHVRHPGEDGMARVICQPAGMRGWQHGENDALHLAKAYPELNEAQLNRACRFLASRVRNHLRLFEQNHAPRGNWINNW